MKPLKKHIRLLRATAAQMIKAADELEEISEDESPAFMFGNGRLSSALERELLIDRVELEYNSRRRRRNFFDGELLGEPGWDLLLDLFVARLREQTISVTSACIAADVPATTGLRWLKQLEQLGMVERIENPFDHRSSWIRLTDKAHDAMQKYFESTFAHSDRMKRSFEEKITLAYGLAQP